MQNPMNNSTHNTVHNGGEEIRGGVRAVFPTPTPYVLYTPIRLEGSGFTFIHQHKNTLHTVSTGYKNKNSFI